ncbi:hypothetical protein AK812_SmicGene8519 [Symbiodinium microadriaticum]|uniref:Uncharacterized protein n=1 Tax=Symbiodinium microadriaticum TaxID=2951 RepID=A0A1Q9EKU0_SYMMI|nr:hypothetical protein AK812_SmicGene8519 [Symbiodinium microadriaticum]
MPREGFPFLFPIPGTSSARQHESSAPELALLFLLLGAVFCHHLQDLVVQAGAPDTLLDDFTVHSALAAAALLGPGIFVWMMDRLARGLSALFYPEQKVLNDFLDLGYAYLPLTKLGLVDAGQVLPTAARTASFFVAGLAEWAPWAPGTSFAQEQLKFLEAATFALLKLGKLGSLDLMCHHLNFPCCMPTNLKAAEVRLLVKTEGRNRIMRQWLTKNKDAGSWSLQRELSAFLSLTEAAGSRGKLLLVTCKVPRAWATLGFPRPPVPAPGTVAETMESAGRHSSWLQVNVLPVGELVARMLDISAGNAMGTKEMPLVTTSASFTALLRLSLSRSDTGLAETELWTFNRCCQLKPHVYSIAPMVSGSILPVAEGPAATVRLHRIHANIMCASVSVSTSRRHMAVLGLMLRARDGFPRKPFPIQSDQRQQMRLQVYRGVPVGASVPEHSLQAPVLWKALSHCSRECCF